MGKGRKQVVRKKSEASRRKPDNEEEDVSFMDTEPVEHVDVSTFNTEPVDASTYNTDRLESDSNEEVEGSVEGAVPVETDDTDDDESSEGNGDDDDEGSEGNGDDDDEGSEGNELDEDEDSGVNESSDENEDSGGDESDEDSGDNESDEDIRGNPFDSELDSLAPVSWSASQASDDDSENSPQPPPIDITMAPSHEVKRIYSDLIDSCRGFDEETFNDSDEILKKNITTGDSLFRQMEMSLSESMNESESYSGKGKRPAALGNSVSELYLACLHTMTCSKMLQQVVRRAGAGDCEFKMDEFLDKLRSTSSDNKGGYSVLLATRQLSITTSSISCSVAHFTTIYGLIDKDDLKLALEPSPSPLVKVRAPRKKDDVKEEDATQKEIMNKQSQPVNQETIDQSSEGMAKNVLKIVRTHYKEKGTPKNMLEIAYADNLPDVLSRLFGIAFVVRDGHVSLSKSGSAGASSSSTLMLKPDQPPEKNNSEETGKRRNQHIASFSSKFLKHLIESGKGFDK